MLHGKDLNELDSFAPLSSLEPRPSQIAQSGPPQITRTTFGKLNEIEQREFGPHETIPRGTEIKLNSGPDLRAIRYEYFFEGTEIGGLDEVMVNSVSVPNGASIHHSVIQTGIPLGFRTADEFRRFRKLLEFGVTAALSARVRGFDPEKFKIRKIGIRGSAVSGQKFIRGEGHVGRVFGPLSDLDIFIISPGALDVLRPPNPDRPEDTLQAFKIVLGSYQARRLGLNIVLRNIARFTGRLKPSILIFRKGGDTSKKEPREGRAAIPAPATILFE